MSTLKEIREAASPALLHAPYRAAGERVMQANNHPQLRPYQLCGGTHSEFMAGSVADALNALPRLLVALESVTELHEQIGPEHGIPAYCEQCVDQHGNPQTYPCSTVAAITLALEGKR